jgi:hypothetical protein
MEPGQQTEAVSWRYIGPNLDSGPGTAIKKKSRERQKEEISEVN